MQFCQILTDLGWEILNFMLKSEGKKQNSQCQKLIGPGF